MSTYTADGHELRELDERDCWRLITDQSVGRLIWHGSDGLTAVPVNHVVDHGVLRIRTTAYSAITRECDDSLVAYEVDAFDEKTRTGWSVLVRGRAEAFFTATQAAAVIESDPWPAGLRAVRLEITPHTITGRYLGGM